MSPRFSSLALATFLTACTMAPDYEQPALPVVDQWPGASTQAVTTVAEPQANAAEIAWTDFFQSASLQKVIQQALDHNRDLRVAVLNIDAARAAYRIQRADLLPTVNARVTESRSGVPPKANFNGVAAGSGRSFIVEQAQANLAVTSFELDLFGRVRSLTEADYQNYLATQEARNAVQVSLIAETANAYLQLLADQKTLGLVNDTLKAQERSFSIVKVSYENGIRSKLDLSQAATTVETARANQAIYNRAVEQDRNALMLLMGITDPASIPVDETLDTVKLRDALPVGLPSEVLLSRPDVRQAEHGIQQQNANIGAARAAFFPVISLTGSYGYSCTSLDTLFKGGTGGAWNFAPQAVMPIFDFGRNLANLDSADIAKETAVVTYEKTIQTAFRQVSDELVARKTLAEQREAQQNLVGATKTAYDLSDARYKSGIDNFLVVLDSQQALFLAQQNEIAVHSLQLTNMVNLYKVLGGGQVSAPVVAPAVAQEQPATEGREQRTPENADAN